MKNKWVPTTLSQSLVNRLNFFWSNSKYLTNPFASQAIKAAAEAKKILRYDDDESEGEAANQSAAPHSQDRALPATQWPVPVPVLLRRQQQPPAVGGLGLRRLEGF